MSNRRCLDTKGVTNKAKVDEFESDDSPGGAGTVECRSLPFGRDAGRLDRAENDQRRVWCLGSLDDNAKYQGLAPGAPR